ncbi:MAG TPA: 3'-5' exonuclease, partial [Pirellulales bacterium]
GYDAAIAAEYLGDRKLANLHKLLDMARSFDRSGVLGVEDFMTQLSEFVAKQPKEPPAAVQAEHRDVVRVMSIHQAKGLEFPIVVVADLDRKTHTAFAAAAYDPVLGPLVRPPDAAYDEPEEVEEEQPGVVGMSLWRMQEDLADAEELTRLFYVATTRAADFLILSSGLVDLGKLTGAWMKLLAERFNLETGAIRDLEADGWLRDELGEHYKTPGVRTVLFEPPAPVDDDREKKASLSQSLEKLDEVRFAPTPIFVPPAPADARARRQFSIARLDGTLHGPYPPGEFLESEATRATGAWARTPAERLGELIHAVFEAVDFRKPTGLPELVRRQAEKLRPLGAPSYDEATALELVQRFFKTKRAKQIAKAVEIQTEVEFLLAWPPGRADDPHGPFLRGIIALLYQTADGAWRLVEFKTDDVTAEQTHQHAQTYEMQMLLYAAAAERITGKSPSGVTLHFLRTGEEVEFEWYALAMNHAAQLIDDAIAKATEEAQQLGGWKRPR